MEILSLSFDPNSRVAMDKSVQRVYVEYRLLGIPMETTETPLSLRKPTDGKEIHYNFIRGKKPRPQTKKVCLLGSVNVMVSEFTEDDKFRPYCSSSKTSAKILEISNIVQIFGLLVAGVPL